MFSLDMTAPSITTPRVRDVSMTQSKSHSHGRIYIGLFQSSTSLSRLLSQRLFVLADASLSVSLLLSFFQLFFGLDNRNVQSFFIGARNYISSGLVQYCCPLFSADRVDVCFKKNIRPLLWFPIAFCLSPPSRNSFHLSNNFSLSTPFVIWQQSVVRWQLC